MEKEILQHIQKLYSVQGTLRFAEKVEQGYLSHNVVLADDARRYFLKQYRFETSERVIESHRAKQFFSGGGIPVLLPIPTLSEENFFEYDGRWYALFPFVQGKQFVSEDLNERALRSMGVTLASIHRSGKNIAAFPIQPRGFSWERDTFLQQIDHLEECIRKNHGNDDYAELALECLALKRKLSQRYDEEIQVDFSCLEKEAHILHGDFHDENVFFDELGNITHVFDWEKVNVGPREFDILHTMNLSCFWRDFSDTSFENVRIFIKAYHAAYPLNAKRFRVAIWYWTGVRIHSLWIMEELYTKGNARVGKLLASHVESLRYLSNHQKEFADRLVGSIG